MDEFVKRTLIDGRAIKLDPPEAEAADGPRGTLGVAKYVKGGVAVDWSGLHATLRFSETFAGQLAQLDAAVEATSRDAPVFVTTVELLEPWELVPLTKEASAQCLVSTHDGMTLRYKRGAPGQRSAAETAGKSIADVCEQLRQQDVMAWPLLMSAVVLSTGTFDEALHRTAAVFKALRKGGLHSHSPGSCFVPRAIVRDVGPSTPWSTLDVATLSEHAGPFMAFAFAVALHDAHLLGGCQYGYARRKGAVELLTVAAFVSACKEAGLVGECDAPVLQELVDDVAVAEAAMPVGEPAHELFSVLEARAFTLRAGYTVDK